MSTTQVPSKTIEAVGSKASMIRKDRTEQQSQHIHASHLTQFWRRLWKKFFFFLRM